MRLRDALDLCSDDYSHDWVQMPSAGWGRPATGMLASLFDPGVADDPRTRPLPGHSIAVYEPDARLSIVWPVPEDDDHLGRYERSVPDWTEDDTHDWKNARPGWAVILLGGAPVWQDLVWYLDWGSGVGGYVPHFEPVMADTDPGEEPKLERWDTSAWSAGLARLLNQFSATGEWYSFDPTPRLVPKPSSDHPVDAQRERDR